MTKNVNAKIQRITEGTLIVGVDIALIGEASNLASHSPSRIPGLGLRV